MRYLKGPWLLLFVALLLPLGDLVLPREYRIADLMRPIFIFAIMGLGLNVVTGYTGLLNLGAAGFMALGAYCYAILTCDIYPFQFGFWSGVALTTAFGLVPGLLLGLPTLRLRGDYLAIVTLGFGEIVQDCLRNLEVITKGTQGINPLPYPTIFGYAFTADNYLPWYYLLLFFLVMLAAIVLNVEHSRVGREWMAVREDELAATCMGINSTRTKLIAFSLGAALCSFAGALWASYLGSSGEPGNYDFQISVIVLCIVIVGGMGSVFGVMIGSLVMIGFNSIVLVKLSSFLVSSGAISGDSVITTPNNWKYTVFGLALILTMRYRPHGLVPTRLRTYEAECPVTEG
jgi:branched-chain amino acid transport system permease protein